MNNAIFNFKEPQNEPIKSYLNNSSDFNFLQKELNNFNSEVLEIPLIINGKEIKTNNYGNVVMPSKHKHVLAKYCKAGSNEVNMAIEAAKNAKEEWSNISWVERASIMNKAAELISTKYRYILNAATMLGQSKNVFQAEIDSICEVVDYLRYNSYFASLIYGSQPTSSNNIINRLEYRPLEGFVFTVTPFNFTAIASNLNTSVALMGNTTVWKPSSTSLLSNYILMKIFKEAGLPDGVINFIPGIGNDISQQVLTNSNLAGIHFTGSTKTFNSLWKGVSNNLYIYKSYPKIVGETGGKDFIFVHESANVEHVVTAIIRGAFEYQGQKCSAASRAYIPESLWKNVKDLLIDTLKSVKIGDVRDFDNFVNAVIDEKSFNNIMHYIDYAKQSSEAKIVFGGNGNMSEGYFIEPTVIQTTNPDFLTMKEEIFGPVITIYVYKNNEFEDTLKICDATSPYALTGSVFSDDRYAFIKACKALRYSAGNFYLNDKPSGAMVGQQPFGGSRKSGTNDKAGSHLNLLRWVSPRTIKETLLPPTNYKYDYMK